MTYLYNIKIQLWPILSFFLGQYMRQETKWKRESGTGLEKVLEPWLRSLSKTIFCNGSARKVLFSMLLTINWVGLGSWNLVGARHMLCRAGELRLYILFHGCVLQTGRSTGQTCDWVLGDSRCNYGRCGHTQTHINTSVIRAGKRRNCHTSSTLEVLETT